MFFFSLCCLIIGFTSPVLVIDPSSKSLEIAKSRPGVETFLGGIEEFLQSNHASAYNKYLMFNTVHHIPDQRRVFEQLHKSMPTGMFICYWICIHGFIYIYCFHFYFF